MDLVPVAHRALLAARRSRAVTRIRVSAALGRAELDLSIAPTARLGRIDVRIPSHARARLHIGAHTVIDDGVEIRLRGGAVDIGEWCEIRSGVRIMAAGDLRLRGENVLSWGVVVHCDEAVTLEERATFGEYVTITDSTHRHVPGGWHVDCIETAPVRVGSDTWVGAKATIGRGVSVGAGCVVGGGAVVTREVPDGHVAVGVPASVRPLTR